MDKVSEWKTARLVSEYSGKLRGIPLGEPVLNDDGSKDAQFDFRFDGAHPPVALEVTSIVDPEFDVTLNDFFKLGIDRELEVEEVDLGSWELLIRCDISLKQQLQGKMAEIIRSGRSRPEGVELQKTKDDGRSICLKGCYSKQHDNRGPISSAPYRLADFSPELADCVRDNSAKLALAESYEKHLAVDVRALRAQDLKAVGVPPFTDSIDVLWVIHSWKSDGGPEPVVWWSTGEGWQTTPNAGD